MTTSVLVAQAGELLPYDIQVLKDYALDAPWEWRKAFEALIERAEEADTLEAEFEKDVEQLKNVTSAAEDLIKEFRSELTTHKGKLPEGLEESLTESLDALEKALEPPPAPAQVETKLELPGGAKP